MQSRRLTARLNQLRSEMARYGIHPIREPVPILAADVPPSLAARLRGLELARRERDQINRRAG